MTLTGSQISRNVQHEAKWRAMGVGRGLWVEVWIVVRSFYEALWGVGYVSGDPVAEMRLGNLDKKQDNTQNRVRNSDRRGVVEWRKKVEWMRTTVSPKARKRPTWVGDMVICASAQALLITFHVYHPKSGKHLKEITID
jgi:hypothetical protein